MLNANHIMNRNRNCTAMVQPKNNVTTSNGNQMSAVSTTGPDPSSTSRNMLPDHADAHNVAQYNSCKNNTASMA